MEGMILYWMLSCVCLLAEGGYFFSELLLFGNTGDVLIKFASLKNELLQFIWRMGLGMFGIANDCCKWPSCSSKSLYCCIFGNYPISNIYSVNFYLLHNINSIKLNQNRFDTPNGLQVDNTNRFWKMALTISFWYAI